MSPPPGAAAPSAGSRSPGGFAPLGANGPFQGGSALPSVQVVVVSYEGRTALLACLDSLARHVRLPIEVTVVDNASSDGSTDAVRAGHPRAQLLANTRNEGFAAACNRGWRAGTADLVLFLNPDAEVTVGAVETLAACLETRPELAIAGPLTRNTDGSVQVSTGPDLSWSSEIAQRRLVRAVARREPSALAETERRHAREHEADWVSGSCLMIRRRCLETVRGFDAGFFLYEEDADLCRRVRGAGWRVLFTPRAEVRHRLGASMVRDPRRSRLEYHRSHLRYYRKHNGPVSRAALAGWLLLRGTLGWFAGLLAADGPARREAGEILSLVVGRRGRSSPEDAREPGSP